MGNFKIFETGQFLEDIEHEFIGQQARIQKKLLAYVYPQLRHQPYFGKNIKKLVGYASETWRYRIGSYRFFYTIDDHKKMAFMISADNHANAY